MMTWPCRFHFVIPVETAELALFREGIIGRLPTILPGKWRIEHRQKKDGENQKWTVFDAAFPVRQAAGQRIIVATNRCTSKFLGGYEFDSSMCDTPKKRRIK